MQEAAYLTALATMHGKTKKGNPRSSGYERSVRDLYVEPEWVVKALLNAERIPDPIWDPACGTGTIPRICQRRGLVAFGTDLATNHDFLKPRVVGKVRAIVCNPPFSLAEQFVRRAVIDLKINTAAFLLRLAFLEGQERRILFETTPLARVLVFSKRVSMPPPGKKVGGGAVAFAWFVWRLGHQGPPTIGWLP